MKFLRISIHSFALTGANIVCIIIAYGIYYAFRPANQIAFQMPIAAVLSIAAFTICIPLIKSSSLRRFIPQNKSDFVWIYFAAFLWTPIIFVPLHLMTQGYLSSFDNIIATWLFQAPVNAIAVFISYRLLTNKSDILAPDRI